MKWMQLQHWLPCLFCGQSRASHHRLCQYCWQHLPWDFKPNIRQEVNFIASCYYEYPLDRTIHAFKDQAEFHYLPLFAGCLQKIPKPQVQAIVPMPISKEKLIQRGFNQTYLLAKALSKHWHLPIWQPIDRHYGDSQRGMDRLNRLHNLQEQFFIAPKANKTYRRVLMLDDVITTGASLFALQQQLRELGCTDIQAICLCNVKS